MTTKTDVPDILSELESVEMHAIVTSEIVLEIFRVIIWQVLTPEVEDPRPWCEIISNGQLFIQNFHFSKKI